jgi:DNA-directed RNA polymerase subunit RPC12/RpoP
MRQAQRQKNNKRKKCLFMFDEFDLGFEFVEIEDYETEDYGTCENCGCKLLQEPNPNWGVGYVCARCAIEIRGEYE